MFASVCRRNLVAVAVAYGRATGLSLATVSRRVYGNANFLDAFRRGEQSVSIDKIEEMLSWFRSNWPAGADWPYLPAVFMRRTRRGK